MVYCNKCGTQFEGRYCPNCGTAVEGGAGPMQTPVLPDLSSSWAGVLCYAVPIAGPLIFLFLAPYSRDLQIRFNAWQALFLQLVWIGAHIIANIFGLVSWRVAEVFHQIVNWVFLAVTVVMAVKAYQLEKVVLPYIGPLAAKQK